MKIKHILNKMTLVSQGDLVAQLVRVLLLLKPASCGFDSPQLILQFFNQITPKWEIQISFFS